MTDVAWKRRPILAGLTMQSAEWSLRERPGSGQPPVGTKASATVAPDFDWRTNGVLWGVVFHRYVPHHPLEMRVKRNETTGQDIEVPPPSIIPEYKVAGRVAVQGDELEAAMQEARKRCEETVQAGRP